VLLVCENEREMREKLEEEHLPFVYLGQLHKNSVTSLNGVPLGDLDFAEESIAPILQHYTVANSLLREESHFSERHCILPSVQSLQMCIIVLDTLSQRRLAKNGCKSRQGFV